MTLSQEISAILGFRVEPGKYAETINKEDVARMGIPTRKQVNDMIGVILDHLDKYESTRPTTDPKKGSI